MYLARAGAVRCFFNDELGDAGLIHNLFRCHVSCARVLFCARPWDSTCSCTERIRWAACTWDIRPALSRLFRRTPCSTRYALNPRGGRMRFSPSRRTRGTRPPCRRLPARVWTCCSCGRPYGKRTEHLRRTSRSNPPCACSRRSRGIWRRVLDSWAFHTSDIPTDPETANPRSLSNSTPLDEAGAPFRTATVVVLCELVVAAFGTRPVSRSHVHCLVVSVSRKLPRQDSLEVRLKKFICQEKSIVRRKLETSSIEWSLSRVSTFTGRATQNGVASPTFTRQRNPFVGKERRTQPASICTKR